MKVEIKTFMPDSKRPNWLIWLLMQVNTYVDPNSTMSNPISVIRSFLAEKAYVKRNARYPIEDCVNIEETDNRLLISSCNWKPIVEFKMEPTTYGKNHNSD